MKLNKKGMAWVWISAVASVFITIFFYIIFSQPLGVMITFANSTLAGTPYIGTLQKLQTFWLVFPILIVIAAALLIIGWALRREQNQYYQ